MKQQERNLLMDLDKYVRVYDNILDTNLCRNILASSKDIKWERWDRGGRPQFDQFNMTAHAESTDHPNDIWNIIHAQIIESVKSVSNKYMEDVQCQQQWPYQNALEQVRLKRYQVEKNDRFDHHADVGDYATARRFLAMFFYINDVEKGGETTFPGRSIQPKEGRCCVFPPMWMFPHTGVAPITNDKYIIGTYLHYV